ncbi:protein PFC0760c-like [Thalassophryne amazonica]|uniref:protein PFC0760c-like n=1 Tax=Thalassophryne amazonica TaxID=390379 RepID=UPI0014717673|nr:protein PFC0760c-like [Thalassophryne amazonica]
MNDRMDIRNRAVFQHSSSQEGGVVLEQDDLVDNGSKDDVLNEVDQADSADMWYGDVGCDHNVEDNTWHIDGNKEGEDDLGQDMGGDSVQNEEMDQGDDEDWHDNGVDSGGDDEDDDFQHGDGEEGNEPDDNYQGFSLEDGNLPIYPDAPITKSQSLLLIVSYVLQHGLSDSALDDLLSLMNIHCPNSVPTSKYLLYKSVEDSLYEVHYYCMACTAYLGPEKLTRNCTNCGNGFSADISTDSRQNTAAKNDESTRSGSCP